MLLVLLAHVYIKPTFTNRLDAFTAATIGAQISFSGTMCESSPLACPVYLTLSSLQCPISLRYSYQEE